VEQFSEVGPLLFVQRPFPSCNLILVRGPQPALIDPGFGSDLDRTEELVREAGLDPDGLALVLNTHFHSDHAGADHGLQERHGLQIAAHPWEADMVNRRDPQACSARCLDQPVESYRVHRLLRDGDVVEAGGLRLLAVHTPGHSLGHLAFFLPELGVLAAGDALHADDVPWSNPFQEGAGALHRTIASVQRLVDLGARTVWPGHGPALESLETRAEATIRRLEGWVAEPRRAAWHACKRIFAYALMIHGGLALDQAAGYLSKRGWVRDYAEHVFQQAPSEFASRLVAEMLRSGGALEQDGRLLAATPHRPPAPGWLRSIERNADGGNNARAPVQWPAPRLKTSCAVQFMVVAINPKRTSAN